MTMTANIVIQELKSLLPQFDVISFDIFDTLFLRNVWYPQDVWEKIGVEFAAVRRKADRETYMAATARGGEHTLDEAYALMGEKWASYKQRELDAERDALCANPEMLELWNEAGRLGKKRIIVSDMYMPCPFLESVLRENGIDGWDGFYLSSKRQCRKRDGRLFELVLKDCAVAPDKILHIGDNEVSDLQQPNRLGIVAFHYPKIRDVFVAENPFVRQFLDGANPSLAKRCLAGALAVGWHSYRYGHPDCTYWNKIGFLFAGTLGYLYARFFGEKAKEQGYDHLMFVARDGYVLKPICEMLYPEIRTDYFYASRFSTMFATQYFGAFGIGRTKRLMLCLRYLKEKASVRFSQEEERRFIEDGVLGNDAQKALDEISAKERRECENYLGTFKINPSRTAMVDGTSGHFTIQKFMGDIVGHSIHTYYLQTLRPTVDGDTLYQCDFGDARYLRFSEFLFGAPVPPVDRVVDGKPIFKSDMVFFEQFKIGVSDQIAKGAWACAESLEKYGVTFSKYDWLDFDDAFMGNLTSEDKMRFSFAADSIDPTHQRDYVNVICGPLHQRRLTLFRRTLIMLKRIRVNEQYRDEVFLLGKWHAPILRRPMNLALRILRRMKQLLKVIS